MKTLAIETSTAHGSVVMHDGIDFAFSEEFMADRTHSSTLFAVLERCFGGWGLPDRIVVGLGPGSYSGVRIAIASVIGIEVGARCHMLGLPSICALDVAESGYSVIGDARRGGFYHAAVRDRSLAEAPVLLTAAELKARFGEDRGSPVYSTAPLAQFPDARLAIPVARILAQLADTAPDSAAPLEPIYLREPHITEAKPVR